MSTRPNRQFDTVKQFFWWFAGEYEFNLMLPGIYSSLISWKIKGNCDWEKIIKPYKRKYDLLVLATKHTHKRLLSAMSYRLPGTEKGKIRALWNVRNVVRALQRKPDRAEQYYKYCHEKDTVPGTLIELQKVFKAIKEDELKMKLLKYEDLDEIAGKTSHKGPPLGIPKQANYAQRYNRRSGYGNDNRRSRSSSRGRGRGGFRGGSRGGRGRGASQGGYYSRGGSRGRGRGRGGFRGGFRGGNRGRGKGYYSDRWSSRFNNNNNRSNNNNNQRGNYKTRGTRGRGRGRSKSRGGFSIKNIKCHTCGKYGHLARDCDKGSELSKMKKQVNNLSKRANKLEKDNRKLLKVKEESKSSDNSNSNSNSGGKSNPSVNTLQRQKSKHDRSSKRGRGGSRGRGRGKYKPSSYGRSAAPPHLEREAQYDRYEEEYDEYGNRLASS